MQINLLLQVKKGGSKEDEAAAVNVMAAIKDLICCVAEHASPNRTRYFAQYCFVTATNETGQVTKAVEKMPSVPEKTPVRELWRRLSAA